LTQANSQGEATQVSFSNEGEANTFFEFAAQSDVEFSKIDVTKDGEALSILSTSHENDVVSTDPSTIKELSDQGYTGIKHTHAHPNITSDPSVPSGHYGFKKGYPSSLTVSDRTYGDAGFANNTRKRPGFGGMKFELYSPSQRRMTTYDGVKKAVVREKK
jgi:hypothetical protein